MAKVKTSDRLVLKGVRLSFPSLLETEFYAGNDTKKYAATFLISKKHPAIKVLQDEIKALKGDFRIPRDKICLKDGSEKEYDGYMDCYFIKASTNKKPSIVTRRGEKIDDENHAQFPYPGCQVVGYITLWLQNNQYGKAVNASLDGVQFFADDESFGAQPMDENEFEAFEEEEEEQEEN